MNASHRENCGICHALVCEHTRAKLEDALNELLPVAEWCMLAMSKLEGVAEGYDRKARYQMQASTSIVGTVTKARAEAIREAIEVLRGIPGWTGEERHLATTNCINDIANERTAREKAEVEAKTLQQQLAVAKEALRRIASGVDVNDEWKSGVAEDALKNL